MNSRFKFRAWDKHRKEMITPADGDFIKWHAMSNWKECLDVMQWTGLQDKNGANIYEGDLVRAYKPNTYLGPNDLLEVRWNEERGCWAYWNHRINRWVTGRGDVPMTIGENRNGRWCEVIGNIYEHSHLLSDERHTS